MDRNLKHAENKIRRGHAEDMEDAENPKKNAPPPPKKEMQDPLTRQDPNCEGEFWDITEDQEKAVAPGKKDDL